MTIDLAGLIADGFKDPRVQSAIAPLLKAAVRDAMKEAAADSWLTTEEASRYVYGRDDRAEALRKVIGRDPELARLAVGSGRMRRFRRADLDQWLRSSPRAQRRRQGGEP